MLTPDQIAKDEGIIAKATSTEHWEAIRFRQDAAQLSHRIEVDGDDADFAVAARTRWPLYVEEVKRLKEELDLWRKHLNPGEKLAAELDALKGRAK